ncbi:hypothetical protein FDP41_007968 [Naegleria fowleri]|uniref:UDP-N-acetylglucosamine--peptide N-acetylglucosaminyltransferase SPINDLY n=1 Tax=Naegleria fowleri TaxID=5763 RepID=A0A6A5C0T3_NAEFO|nr:uncharacterized protein FDP41_007968 [Naegleria fowleri]KAF0984053.1 hypothetical protein FDP41_007968 [Naegleria fowleri]CAG4716940.1 unnamed protein product [Naegleria fowleri]
MNTSSSFTSSNTSVPFDVPSSDGVVIQVDLVNDAFEEIESLLFDEKPPLDCFIRIAVLYYQINRIDLFEKLLKRLLSESSFNDYYGQYEYTEAKVEVLNILAGYQIERYNKVSSSSNDKNISDDASQNRREEIRNEIEKLIQEAEQLNPSKVTNFLSRAVLHLNLGEVDKAEGKFDYVLTVDKNNIPALLGMGCVRYNQGHFKEALAIYEQCMRLNPQGPADIRLGLGMCHYQLENYQRARQCFERVLKLDPNNVAALVSLAIMDLNSNDENLVQNAVKNNLRKAYSLDPTNPQVLNLLGNHFIFKKDTDKALQLSYTAFENSTANKIKAESCYNIARAYHIEKEYSRAFGFYYRIISSHWSGHTLAHYGLGQMYIQRNEIDNAINEFETVLKTEPENLETNRILGKLYARKRDPKKTIKYFKKVLKKDPEDLDALIRIGEYERCNTQQALANLKKGQEILEERGTSISFELYNNIGVHQYQLGQYQEAENNFKKALSLTNCKALDNLDDLEEQSIDTTTLSLVYNIARLYERTKAYDTAEKLFLKIAAQHPSYINAYLRIASIQQAKGNYDKAIQLCKLTTSLEPTNPVTWSFLGQTFLEQNNFTEAQKAFEYIVQNIEKNDIYALLGLGNIYFRSLRVPTKTNDEKYEKEHAKIEKYLEYALGFFEKAMKLDGSNLYATMNSGCVLCENGYTEDGKALMNRVREVCVGDYNDKKENPETYINLGHLAMLQKQYAQAEKLYSTCSKRFFNDENTLVLAFLAKSYFDNANYDSCLDTLSKIEKIDSNNLTVKYNFAITYYEKINTITSQKNKSLQNAELLEEYLHKALDLFKEISNKDINASQQQQQQKKISSEFSLPDPVVIHKANEYIKILDSKVREKIQKYREKAENEEKARESLKIKQEQAFKLLEEENKRRLEEEERERREREEKMKRIYMENIEKIENIMRSAAISAADEGGEEVEESKKTKKRKKKEVDEGVVTQGDDQQPPETKKKKKSKEPKEKKSKKDSSKKKSRLKKKADETAEPEQDKEYMEDEDLQVEQHQPARTVEDEDEDEYMASSSRATAEGEEEFSFDNE